jgi:dTDP-glucose pyrophosphorylase
MIKLNKHNFIDINSSSSDIFKRFTKLSHKIMFVLENQKLAGTITDGDLRNYILNFKHNISLKLIMNKKPKYIFSNKEISKNFKYAYKNIRYLPIVNEKKKIIKVLDLSEEFIKNTSVEICILAGGYGKRLYPITKKIPKPLIPINGIPNIERILKFLIKNNFRKFNLFLGYKSDLIIKFIKKKFSKNYFKFYVEKSPLGTAGPLTNIKLDKKTPLIVINADLVTDVNLPSLLYYHFLNKADVTVCIKKQSYNLQFAEILIKRNKIIKINEKPNKNYYFNAGIYILNSDMIEYLKKNAKKDMPEFLELLIKNKKNIKAFYLYEKWFDYGTGETLNLFNKKLSKTVK